MAVEGNRPTQPQEKKGKNLFKILMATIGGAGIGALLAMALLGRTPTTINNTNNISYSQPVYQQSYCGHPKDTICQQYSQKKEKVYLGGTPPGDAEAH
ncbi:MAG: hypothetical protein QXL88_00620 [Candidatus Pacearchaeota archaeon]